MNSKDCLDYSKNILKKLEWLFILLIEFSTHILNTAYNIHRILYINSICSLYCYQIIVYRCCINVFHCMHSVDLVLAITPKQSPTVTSHDIQNNTTSPTIPKATQTYTMPYMLRLQHASTSHIPSSP